MTPTDSAPADHESSAFDQRGQQVHGPQTNILYTGDDAYDVRGLENPYLGLKAFTYAERARYTGRDEEITRALALLTTSGNTRPLLFITGASGSGKSSFTQAGLIPVLEQHYHQQGDAIAWAIFRPGEKPLAALARALYTLKLSATGLFAAAASYQVASPVHPTPANQISLLIIDQFEELFSQADTIQRMDIFHLLTHLPPFHELQMHIIATLRADYLPDLFPHKTLYEVAKRGIDLRAMDAAQLESAIQRPLQARHPNAGKRFQIALLKRLAGDAAEDAAYLPLLQVTLEDLWRTGLLTVDYYTSLADAISRRADAVFAQTHDEAGNPIPRSPQEQATILNLFLDLIDVSVDDDQRRDVRRTRRLEDLTRGQPIPITLVRQLATERLLSTTAKHLDHSGQPVQTVDIIHESLIRNWPRLREAIQSQRAHLQQRRRFELRLADWQRHGQSADLLLTGVYLAEAETLQRLDDVALQLPDAKHYVAESIHERDRIQQAEIERQRALAIEQTKRARTFRWATVIVTILLVLALAAAGWAAKRENDARTSAATAQAESTRADHQAAVAATRAAEAESRALAAAAQTEIQSNPMRAWLLAIEAGKFADTNQAFAAINQQAATIAQPLTAWGPETTLYGAQWNQDNSRLLTWGDGHTVRVWDTASGALLHTFTFNGSVVAVQWSGDNNRLLAWGYAPTVDIWEVISGELVYSLTLDGSVGGAQWSGNDSRILTWGDKVVRIWNAANRRPLNTLTHDDYVSGAQWSYNGSRILTWSYDKTARLWDADSGELLHTLTHNGSVFGAQWSGNNSHILTWIDGTSAHVWDADSGELLHTFTHDVPVVGARWNQDGSRILSWSQRALNEPGAVRLWDADSGELLHTFTHKSGVWGARWNQNESRILTWSEDNTARIWNAATGQPLHTFTHNGAVGDARWNSDESRIFTLTYDQNEQRGLVHLWDADSGELLPTLTHDDAVWGARWNQKESRILSWSSDKTARLWDAGSSELLHTFTHTYTVRGAQWSHNESRVLTWSYDKTARLWDVNSGELLRILTHDGHFDGGAQWSDDDSQILTWDGDLHVGYREDQGHAYLWDAASGELLRTLTHDRMVLGAQWNGNDSQILTWSLDGAARLWDANSGELLHTLRHDFPVEGAQWDQEESSILTWSYTETAHLWDADSGELLRTFANDDYFSGAQWSGDESRILTWSGMIYEVPGAARIWDVESGELLHTFRHERAVFGAQWSGNDNYILTWSYDNTSRIWDATSGKLLHTLPHDGPVWGATWSRDSSRILSWSADNPVRIWDAREPSGRGQSLRTITGDGSEVISAQWNHDETQIMITTMAGHIYRYHTRMADLLTAACARATRNLTWSEWQLYLPGQPYRPTCPNLPIHPSVPPNMIATPTPTTS